MNMEIWKGGKENGTLASFEFLSFECSLAAEDVYE